MKIVLLIQLIAMPMTLLASFGDVPGNKKDFELYQIKTYEGLSSSNSTCTAVFEEYRNKKDRKDHRAYKIMLTDLDNNYQELFYELSKDIFKATSIAASIKIGNAPSWLGGTYLYFTMHELYGSITKGLEVTKRVYAGLVTPVVNTTIFNCRNLQLKNTNTKPEKKTYSYP